MLSARPGNGHLNGTVKVNYKYKQYATATALATDHTQFYSENAKQAKGMFKQRIRKAWGHTAHSGWARLLLDRRRDLIIRGPASHRTCPDTAGGLTEDELEHHNYHHPDRGGTAA